MLALKCLRLPIFTATKRPLLSAFMSSEPSQAGFIHDFLQSATKLQEDKFPPKAPSDSFPRDPPLNPISNRRQFTGPDVPVYCLYWNSTKHNTVATFTNHEGHIRGWVTGGSCGFKHTRRGEYEAGYQCAIRIFKKIEEELAVTKEPFKLHILYKGFGQGRQALDSVLMTSEGENIRPLLSRMTDRTPLKIGGTRARKARRL
jgi:small subunit ribosomal protein S11